MSWSFEIAGSKETVKELIDKQSNCPEPLREMMKTQADALITELDYDKDMEYHVFVKSFGHLDSANGGNATMAVHRIAVGKKQSQT